LALKSMALLLVGVVLLLIAYFAPSAYRKAQMDKEVDRLCALDGGSRVFERVLLPSDKFDQFGYPNVPLSSSKGAQSASYVVDTELSELVKGNPTGRGAPSLHRFSSKIVRVSDKKILGEAVGYYRFGGDPEGPWHPSSYTGCTEEAGKNLIRAIFRKIP
jgi:hypothetical protein